MRNQHWNTCLERRSRPQEVRQHGKRLLRGALDQASTRTVHRTVRCQGGRRFHSSVLPHGGLGLGLGLGVVERLRWRGQSERGCSAAVGAHFTKKRPGSKSPPRHDYTERVLAQAKSTQSTKYSNIGNSVATASHITHHIATRSKWHGVAMATATAMAKNGEINSKAAPHQCRATHRLAMTR